MGFPARSSGADDPEATEVLTAAFEELFIVLGVHVELVRVEDADVRQAFVVDEHVFRLEGLLQGSTQEHFFARVKSVECAGDGSQDLFAGALGERLVLPHVVEQVAIPESARRTGRTPS
jgi:hypothetical protein